MIRGLRLRMMTGDREGVLQRWMIWVYSSQITQQLIPIMDEGCLRRHQQEYNDTIIPVLPYLIQLYLLDNHPHYHVLYSSSF